MPCAYGDPRSILAMIEKLQNKLHKKREKRLPRLISSKEYVVRILLRIAKTPHSKQKKRHVFSR